eukprot:scaffold186484_cov37-Prasinocladus_malaysianus.AAC.2
MFGLLYSSTSTRTVLQLPVCYLATYGYPVRPNSLPVLRVSIYTYWYSYGSLLPQCRASTSTFIITARTRTKGHYRRTMRDSRAPYEYFYTVLVRMGCQHTASSAKTTKVSYECSYEHLSNPDQTLNQISDD